MTGRAARRNAGRRGGGADDPPHSRRYPRSDAEMAAKLGVMIRLEGETVTVMPKPEERAEDAFDLVRMKR